MNPHITYRLVLLGINSYICVKSSYMESDGTIKTSVSLSSGLWNEVQKVLKEDEITFSRWVQKSSRLMLRTIKRRNIKEYIESLDENEVEILKNEIKKRE